MSIPPETLASYVPTMLVRRLAAEPAVPDPASAEGLVGDTQEVAALFADLSGFSALAGRLARRGAAGTEQLSAMLKTVFGQIVELIRGHGGDVLKFAGDGVLAVWPVGFVDHRLDVALARAADCALAVRAAIDGREVQPGVTLAAKVGVGVGPMSLTLVGGVRGRAEIFVTGAGISEAIHAEAAAARGEVTASAAAWAALRDKAQGRTGADGTVRLESMSQSLTARPAPLVHPSPALALLLRHFIPGVVRARLEAGQSDFEAELRRISVLFINLPTLGERPDQAHRVLCAIQEELYRYEGALHHMSVDEKGPTVVGAFGLPPLAHEDDPSRAVLAALDLQATLAELGQRAALGLATGRVFCGSVGHPLRREYSLVGDTVIRAARLMQAAPDSLLCDAASTKGAGDRVSFDAGQSIQIKGRAERLMVYRPLARRRLQRAPDAGAALVGRREEREQIVAALADLRRDGPTAGGVLIIEGEAGLGKSQLISELLRLAGDLKVLRGAAEAVSRANAYNAWRGVFAGILGATGNTADTRLWQMEALHLITRDATLLDLAPLLNAVVPLDLPESDVTRGLSGEARVVGTRDLLMKLLHQKAARQPLVVVLEDLQWMDSASWALLAAAQQRVHPLLLVLTTRPLDEAPPEVFEEIKRAPGARLVRLGPIPLDEVSALLCQQLGVDRIPRPVLEFIHQKAGGYPHFSQELALALREAGLITVADGVCALSPDAGDLGALDLPDTVQGVVTSRIDRLAPGPQLTLKVASVIGRRFRLRCLTAVFPVLDDRGRIGAYLAELREASLAVPVPDAPEPTWAFRDTLCQQVARELMTFAQRRELHRATARWIEEESGEDPSLYYGPLAWHWQEAGDPIRALSALEKAATGALAGGAWREAAGFYGEMLRLVQQPEGENLVPAGAGRALTLGRWERQRGLALVESGLLGEGRAALLRALTWLGAPCPEDERGVGLGVLKAAWEMLLRRLRPLQVQGEEAQRCVEAALAYERLSEVLYLNQEASTAFYAMLRTVNLAARAGPSALLALVQANLALGFAALPLRPLAVATLNAAWSTAEAVGGLAPRARVEMIRGQDWMGQARWEEAERALSAAVRDLDETGNARHLATALLALGTIRTLRGHYAEALALMARVDEAAARVGDLTWRGAALKGEALIAARQGRPREAMEILTRATRLLDSNTSLITEMTVLGQLASAHLAVGDAAAAAEVATRALSLMRGARPTAVNALSAYASVAEVALAMLERAGPDRAARLVAAGEAVGALAALARIYPVARPIAGLWRGHLERLRGRPAAAARRFRAALKLAQGLDMPYEARALHLALAAHGPAAERAGHAQQAAALERRLGLGPATEAADEAPTDPGLRRSR